MSGEFVDFSEGKNGFKREEAFGQTIIHHSLEYRNVIVQANILDAVAHEDYFTSIISKYAAVDDKVIVYSDVNATILMEDTIEGKATSGVLLSTMFALAEVQPGAKFDLEWDSLPVVTVEKQITLKQLVRNVSQKDNDYYHRFWSNDSCGEFLLKILSLSDVCWSPTGEKLTKDRFWSMYDKYSALLQNQPTVSGMIHFDHLLASFIPLRTIYLV